MIAAEGIARDITEQVQAEAEIVERELLSRSVLESIQGPATVVDAEGMIRAVNADWTRGMLHHRDAPTTGSGRARTISTLCDEETSRGIAGAAQAAAGLRAVLSGAEESFLLRLSRVRHRRGALVRHAGVSPAHRDRWRRRAPRRHHRPQAVRAAARPARAPRLPHRSRQPGAALRPPRRQRWPVRRPRTPSVGTAAPRPRPLQHRQRRPRPRGGRRPARGRLGPAPQARPSRRHASRGSAATSSSCSARASRSDQAAGALADRIVNAFNAPLRDVDGEPSDRHHEHRRGAR